MQRFLSALFGIAFVATLGTGASFAATAAKGSAMSSTMASTKCAKGSSYVKGYKTKAGKSVKGYCRADKKPSTMMKKSK